MLTQTAIFYVATSESRTAPLRKLFPGKRKVTTAVEFHLFPTSIQLHGNIIHLYLPGLQRGENLNLEIFLLLIGSSLCIFKV